jgi:hypothetical protein
MEFAPGVLETGNDANYRTVPKDRSRSIFPVRAGWIQNRLIPVEPFSNAAIRPRLRRGSGCKILQFRGDDVVRVPELARSAIRDSSKRAPARRSPVCRKDRLPHHEHAHLSIVVPGQQVLSCGGPPQTGGSSRRQQQNDRGPKQHVPCHAARETPAPAISEAPRASELNASSQKTNLWPGLST